MACERYVNAINEFVDGTLGPLRRAELELHLETCEACASLLADFQEIARAAQALDDLQPPERVWTAVAQRLRQEGRVVPMSRAILRRPNYTVLALAAALVLAVGASLLLLVPRRAPTTAVATPTAPHSEPVSNAPVSEPVQGVAAGVSKELALVDSHLQQLVEEVRKPGSSLPPETAAALEQSLTQMTDAVETSRKALEGNPQNVAALNSFYDVLRQKIKFLQNTIALMNEMRQGDAAGAAEIVESGKS